jgi:hypothetical protein
MIGRMRFVGVALVLALVFVYGLGSDAAPAGAVSPWICGDSAPAVTGADAVVQDSGVTLAPVGASIGMTLGHPKGVIDPTSVAFDIVRQEDGTTEQLRADTYGLATFRPHTADTYLISASFSSWDCSAGPGTQSQLKGPFTTAQVKINVVEPDPPTLRYYRRLWPKNPTFAPGSAEFGASANCPPASGSLKPITMTMRYTTDGRAPTRHSPGVSVTAPHGCADDGHPRYRHGVWGSLDVGSVGAFASVTPGHVMRVWLELRWDGRVLSAIRVRSRERDGRQRWVLDTGRCPAAPGGCARRLQEWPRPRSVPGAADRAARWSRKDV